jgi:hypothetical protein
MGAGASVAEGRNDILGSPTKPKRKTADLNELTPQITERNYPTFDVSLGFWPGKTVTLPDSFKLRVAYESLDFIRSDDETPLIQFPFQNIICWGSSRQNFQFKVFNFEDVDPERKDNGILISLKSSQGRMIEDTTMSTVQKLMVDINQRAISKQEFAILQNTLFDENQHLRDDWMTIINQFTTGGRSFLAKQGMELLIHIGNVAPFEKFDLACLLYERIINKDSFQLLVNTFPDEQERDNLIHRLKLNKDIVKNCTILPEKAENRALMVNSNNNAADK